MGCRPPQIDIKKKDIRRSLANYLLRFYPPVLTSGGPALNRTPDFSGFGGGFGNGTGRKLVIVEDDQSRVIHRRLFFD